MEDEIIKFETAKLAKEKEFNLIVKEAYSFDSERADVPNGEFSNKGDKYFSAPTQSLLQRWIREIHKIDIVIIPVFKCYNISRITKYDESEDHHDDFDLEGLDFKDFDSYEDALEDALQESLKFINNG